MHLNAEFNVHKNIINMILGSSNVTHFENMYFKSSNILWLFQFLIVRGIEIRKVSIRVQ